jgi:ribosomal-protein-serine acetyltransferase
MITINVDEQLCMRTLEAEDAQELFVVVDRYRQHLRPWLNWVDGNTSVEHTLQFIHLTLQQQESQEGLVLGIFSEGRIIGELGMHNWNHSLKKAQIGYWLTADHEGKSILYKCLTKFLDFLFESVGLNKIEIHFVPQNKRSGKVAERLGCKIEGLLRQSYLRNGNLEDLVIAGLLRTDWQVLKKTPA